MKPATILRNPMAITLAVFAALYAFGAWKYSGFGSATTFGNLFRDRAALGIAAIGMTVVILAAGIDLSVGSVVGFTSIALAALVTKHHLPPLVAFGIVLALGTLHGVVQGWLIERFQLPPFLVTLSGMFLIRGLAFFVSLEAIAIEHPIYAQAADLRLAGLPVVTVVLLAMFALAAFGSRYTALGRNVLAIGCNRQSALLMGLPVGFTTVAVYAMSGFCAALAGLTLSLDKSAGYPLDGQGMELDAIAAVVIGGTALTGGRGAILGTLVGVLILGVIQTLITFEGTLSSHWVRIASGGLLLLFLGLQQVIETKTASFASQNRGGR